MECFYAAVNTDHIQKSVENLEDILKTFQEIYPEIEILCESGGGLWCKVIYRIKEPKDDDNWCRVTLRGTTYIVKQMRNGNGQIYKDNPNKIKILDEYLEWKNITITYDHEYIKEYYKNSNLEGEKWFFIDDFFPIR